VADINDGIVRHIISYLDNHVYTATPAKVSKVSEFKGQQLVDVEPLITKRYEDNFVLPPPSLPNVPVIFPSAGGGLLSFPIAIGDTVLVIFNKYSIENWLEGTGELNTPDISRSFNISDGVAIPGLYTTQTHLTPDPDDVELKFNNSSFKLKSSKNGDGVDLTTTGNVTINCVDANINTSGDTTITAGGDVNLTPTGDVAIDASAVSSNATITVTGGDVIADGITLKTHVHTQGVDSAGNTQQNTGVGI
jgi:hypothetical protein